MATSNRPVELCQYIRQCCPDGPRRVIVAEIYKVHAKTGRVTIKTKTGMLLVVSGKNIRRLE